MQSLSLIIGIEQESFIVDPFKHSICLTLDVEPDYGRCPTTHILNATGPFFNWMVAEAVPLTAFVTGKLIESGHPIVDRLLEAGVSVELHGYTHQASDFGSATTSHSEEINRGTEAYVKRFGQIPAGYRAPAGVISADDLRLLASLGYRYDSSVFPVRRRGRYNFTQLPHSPFLWQESGLLEFPIGLLTPRLPAGLTFINLLGPLIASRLMARSAGHTPGPYIIDGHFHNLFSNTGARSTLPWPLRQIYAFGNGSNGLKGLGTLVNRLRNQELIFSDLHALALQCDSGHWPVVALDSLKDKR